MQFWKDDEPPKVDEVTQQFQEYEDSTPSSIISSVEKMSDKMTCELQQLRGDLSYSPPVQAHISAIDNRHPLAQEKEYRSYTPWGTLWFYLRDHRKDMRKWDGKPTSILESKQLQLPQLLKRGPVLQSLHQPHCPSLDTLQHLSVLPKLRGPELDTVLEVCSRKCGLDEWTVGWIENWLNGRSQRVVVSGKESSCKPVTSGVSNGSILGPLFFISVLDKGKQGQVNQEDYRGAVCPCREKNRMAKAQFELKLPRTVVDNKQVFFKYGNSKKRTKENIGLLLDEPYYPNRVAGEEPSLPVARPSCASHTVGRYPLADADSDDPEYSDMVGDLGEGVTDSDSLCEIQIMAWTPVPPCYIPEGQRLAQLIPFYNLPPPGERERGFGAFGSTGEPQIFWTKIISASQPMLICHIDERKFKGLVDSGADVTIIKDTEWPSEWAMVFPVASIQGVGGMKRPRAIDQPFHEPIKLTWKTEDPIWVNQWPLKKEWLVQLRNLVQEQLDAGHIASTSSPWNTPVFCVPKKSGKWRMLQDLRAVNAVIEPMGALQSGLPSPAMLPAGWPRMVIDLKDCFFTIFLHPSDAPCFAFSVPALNHAEPMKKFHWVVLPQGMRNSPTICQTMVAKAICPVRELYPSAIIYHYMDDILVATAKETDLPPIMTALTNAVREAGLQVTSEKIQRTQPWAYLGWKITQQEIVPQPLTLKVKDTLTLHDLQ
ncbi:hypothetical protein BTVI_47265 [Pitangus sulphuratus]|nr:hypothetical protein BTVI_47265 [Pitangus sulphuratus]